MTRLKAKFGGRVIAPEMIEISGGSYRMGCVSGKDCQTDDKPIQYVTVRDFYMGKTEVTFDQWDACVADDGCAHYPNDAGWGRGNQPVINVSWADTQTFISWLNKKTGRVYRLPTEAEWEYAARAGSTTKYSWGNDIGRNKANCDGCGSKWDNKRTAPVGQFPANRYGLHDMHGNVWEWCSDGYEDKGDNVNTSAIPKVTDSHSRRVLLGGSWLSFEGYLRSAYRNDYAPNVRANDLGFRLVRQAF